MNSSVLRLASIAAFATAALAAQADIFLGALNGRSFFLTSAAGSALSQEAYAVSLGGHLASIHSLAEQNLISTGVATYSTDNLAWIGFTDQATEGSFQWFDGSAVDFTFWSGGEPNDLNGEDYTVINWNTSTGGWNDLASDNYAPQAVYSIATVPGPMAALPFALLAIKRRKRA